MRFNGWNNFEDLARACGYTNSDNTSETNNNNDSNESNNIGCSDIPNGFQSISPELFIIIGEILGNMIAGGIPSNVQNSLGNWLELVGQAILTYNAQQQYFEQGPARYFNPNNYNVNNSFCNTASTNTPNNNSNSNSKDKNSDSNSSENNSNKIEALELRINQLTTEIEKMKNMLEKLS